MPLEAPIAPTPERVIDLNIRYRHHGALAVLEHALIDPQIGNIALVSSFGAQSVALLHMLSVLDRSAPVLFVDTELLFKETLTYQAELADQLGLTNVQIIRPDRGTLFAGDTDAMLHRLNPDACCALRKTAPLKTALSGYDAWITGRKRFQASTRLDLTLFEADDQGRIKVNPLANWSSKDVQDYIANNNLPHHPLVARGYLSIGCAPCTSRVNAGEDERAGRWRGQAKTECGIHFENGSAQRNGLAA